MDKLRKFVIRFYLPILLILLLVLFSVTSPFFFSRSNLTNILTQNAYVIVAAMGVSLIMISGGADLSISYQIGFYSVLMGRMLAQWKLPVPLVVAACLAAGVAFGAFNGLLTVQLKVHPMVATLATMTIFQGAAYLFSGSRSFFGFPDSFKAIGQHQIFRLIPVNVLITIVMVALAYLILNKTYFGRYIYAIGGNEEAARLAGINVKLVRVMAFVLSGFFVSVSALLLTARTGTASVNIAAASVFDCFTACMLGGISFRGGSGNILGVLFGVLIVGTMGNGMQLWGLSIYWQYVVKGVLLVGAIAFDNYQKASRERQLEKTARREE